MQQVLARLTSNFQTVFDTHFQLTSHEEVVCHMPLEFYQDCKMTLATDGIRQDLSLIHISEPTRPY